VRTAIIAQALHRCNMKRKTNYWKEMYSRLPKPFDVAAGMPIQFGLAAFGAKINAFLIHIVRAYQAAAYLE
jgi:hypothetical protein